MEEEGEEEEEEEELGGNGGNRGSNGGYGEKEKSRYVSYFFYGSPIYSFSFFFLDEAETTVVVWHFPLLTLCPHSTTSRQGWIHGTRCA